MKRRGLYTFVIFFVFLISFFINDALACEVCTIPRLGRQDKIVKTEDADKKWFVEFLYERQNWNEWPARDAHLLHEDGHDVHNKTVEEFFHLIFGREIIEDVSLLVQIPYVIRNSRGVADGKVGNRDRSEGIGDLTTILNYRFYKNDNFALSAVGGIKSPTGKTDDNDSAGDRFELELQPGSGSTDYLLGEVFEYHKGRFIIKGNATYSFKTEGDQDFEFGDLFSSSLFVDYVINPDSETFKTKAGIDINYQFAQKDKDKGVKDPDSGGNTLLLGPAVTVTGPKNTSLFANFLYPVYQDLGGFHQEMNFVWTAGGRIEW